MKLHEHSEGGFLLGAAILAVGIGLGFLVGGGFKVTSEVQPVGSTLNLPEAYTGPALELDELRFDMAPEVFDQLMGKRAAAIELGRIGDQQKGWVSGAMAGPSGASEPARLRLKGDLLDHVLNDRWSMVVELEGANMRGMRSFSMQAPATRNYMWEWFVQNAARREGLLAPHSLFVSATIQGEPRGVYYVEERFAKELLESQERRMGPIVKFDESAFWPNLFQHTNGVLGLPTSVGPALNIASSHVTALGATKLARDPVLARQIGDATGRLAALRDAAVAAHASDVAGGKPYPEVRQEVADVIEQVVDLERVARMHALQSLTSSHHGLIWHNLRYYFDPVTAKLEPILSDAMGMLPLFGTEPVGMSGSLYGQDSVMRCYRASPKYLEALAIEHGRVVAPGYLEALLEELLPELREIEAQLIAADDLPPAYRVDNMVSQLFASRAALRKALQPKVAIMGSGLLVSDGGAERLEIQLWPTTAVPLVIDSFVFENGLTIRTADLETGQPIAREMSEGVLLLEPAQHVVFAMDANERLATLSSIHDLLDDVGGSTGERIAKGLAVTVRWRLAGQADLREFDLRARRVDSAWAGEGSRPAAPSLSEALARHKFLAWDLERKQLHLRPGTWDVGGDLVIPSGLDLFASAGVELRFDPGALFLSDAALRFSGTAELPIRLGPKAPFEQSTWGGLVVIDAKRTSVWKHVEVSRTTAITRYGWATSGGVCFYRSNVKITGGGFLNAQGEDALNVFGSTASLQNVLFQGSVSDSLDADFSQLTVSACRFTECAADAIDTSGGRAQITDCDFTSIGDKCLSAGEGATVEITGSRIKGASIGIAAKDASKVKANDVTMQAVRTHALCAYVKKPAFGPASITAKAINLLGENGANLVQTGSSIELDGKPLATQDFDTKALYATGILGN